MISNVYAAIVNVLPAAARARCLAAFMRSCATIMSGSLRPKSLIAAMFLLVGMASAQHCRKIDIDRSSGSCTVPDPALTPGEIDPGARVRLKP
jgi:hypothetical protein